jgi:hypothetical protein
MVVRKGKKSVRLSEAVEYYLITCQVEGKSRFTVGWYKQKLGAVQAVRYLQRANRDRLLQRGDVLLWPDAETEGRYLRGKIVKGPEAERFRPTIFS